MDQLFCKKQGFLFQGMGADYCCLVPQLDETQKEILHVYCDRVHQRIGLNLWGYLFHSSILQYDGLFCSWVAIYTVDHLIYHDYRKCGLEPGLLLGYSMGLITALACGGAITFETGLDLLLSTSEYLRHKRDHAEAMAVIIGLTYTEVAGLIWQYDLASEVAIASENNEHCIVISGLRDSVERLLVYAQREGALKIKDLKSPYAIHSRYAVPDIEKFIKAVAKAKIADCAIPLVSTLNQEVLRHAADLKLELMRNMTLPMNWKATLQKAETLGTYDFVEVSFENSLTKVSKLVNPEYHFFNYDQLRKFKFEAKAVNK